MEEKDICFLAFNDIQSDYYQIPSEDKEKIKFAEEKIREDLKNKNIENSQENFQEELTTTLNEENNKKDDSETKKEFREEVKSSYGIKRY